MNPNSAPIIRPIGILHIDSQKLSRRIIRRSCRGVVPKTFNLPYDQRQQSETEIQKEARPLPAFLKRCGTL